MLQIKSFVFNIIKTTYTFFRKAYYKIRLKNNNFTILSSNCIGGIIYNLLGEQFLSPTINMWLMQRDFIKFAINTQFYLDQKLEFIDSEEVTPVAKCGDIFLHFNHSKNEFDAEKDWNRRKKRVNLNNLFVIFYDREDLTIDEIREIEKANVKNIAILTNRDLPLKYAVKLRPELSRKMGEQCLDKDKYGIRTFEKQWDFVKWLNSNLQL